VLKWKLSEKVEKCKFLTRVKGKSRKTRLTYTVFLQSQLKLGMCIQRNLGGAFGSLHLDPGWQFVHITEYYLSILFGCFVLFVWKLITYIIHMCVPKLIFCPIYWSYITSKLQSIKIFHKLQLTHNISSQFIGILIMYLHTKFIFLDISNKYCTCISNACFPCNTTRTRKKITAPGRDVTTHQQRHHTWRCKFHSGTGRQIIVEI
jgi:hypothetical protein